MQDTLYLFKVGMTLSLLLSTPVLVVIVVVGLLLSLVQAAFQLQDQTLPIVVKLVLAAVILSASWNWMSGQLVQFTQWTFERVESIGGDAR